jgi:eukaryotic-like serine/threonine-protein kinase
VIGTTLGCYRIVEQLGAGGMGVVYKAEDTQLGRFAALKVLPSDVSQDAQALERFLREARAVASLNHPNICSIYQIGDENGIRFIAMELLEGKNLRDRIVDAPIRLDQLLDWSVQFSAGLDAAHSKCILHRDIKPANLFLTEHGVAKILDFGLAKTVLKRQPAGMAAAYTTAVTTDAHLTTLGTTVGTVAYMSPEQAAGEQLDQRSDLFSFGVVLYEMATQEVPFKGNTAAAIYGAILHVPAVAPSLLNPDVSPELERIILKLLEKDRDLRYQSAAELRADLKRLKRDTDSGPSKAAVRSASGSDIAHRSSSQRVSGRGEKQADVPQKSKAPLIAVMAALVVLVTVAAIYFANWHKATSAPDTASLAFQNRRIMRLTSTGTASAGAISPDGRYVVHVSEENGMQSLWVRQIVTNSNVEIVPKAEVHFSGISISPDENFVYYTAGAVHSPVNELYQVPVLGGTPRKLLSDIESRVSFSPDGKQFAFIRGDQEASYVMLASADGSNAHVLMQTKLPEEVAAVSWTPDGSGVAFGKYSLNGGYHSEIWLYPFSGNPRQLTSHHWFNINDLAYLHDGSGLVVDGTDPDSLFASQLWLVNAKDGKLRRITNDLNSYRGVTLSQDDNQLCTVLHETSTAIWATGGKTPQQFANSTSKLDALLGLSWTPDGRIVYTAAPTGSPEIWIANADGSNAKQLIAGSFFNSSPVVSSSNKIYFTSSRGGNPDVWRVDLDGSNAKQITFGAIDLADAVTPDGKWLIFRSVANGVFSVFKVQTDGGTPVKLADVAGTPVSVSPDGKQIAFSYVDEAAGEWRVGVVPLDQSAPLKMINLDHLAVQWMPDGKGFSFLETHHGYSNVWFFPLDSSAGRRHALTNFDSQRIFNYAWSKDGKLAMSRGSDSSDVILISSEKQ